MAIEREVLDQNGRVIGTERIDDVPTTTVVERRDNTGLWIAAAVIAILAMGAIFWFVSQNQRASRDLALQQQLDQANAAAEAATQSAFNASQAAAQSTADAAQRAAERAEAAAQTAASAPPPIVITQPAPAPAPAEPASPEPSAPQ